MPHWCLKIRRLAMARSMLVDRDGPLPLIKSVALGFGFRHLGQFALDYRAMYGETPSMTLARARSWTHPAAAPEATPAHSVHLREASCAVGLRAGHPTCARAPR